MMKNKIERTFAMTGNTAMNMHSILYCITLRFRLRRVAAFAPAVASGRADVGAVARAPPVGVRVGLDKRRAAGSLRQSGDPRDSLGADRLARIQSGLGLDFFEHLDNMSVATAGVFRVIGVHFGQIPERQVVFTPQIWRSCLAIIFAFVQHLLQLLLVPAGKIVHVHYTRPVREGVSTTLGQPMCREGSMADSQ